MRNRSRLFETGASALANTQYVNTFQPRKPFNIVGANGGFKVDESGNSLALSLSIGTDNTLGVGPVPGTYAAYFDGSTIFERTSNDAALTILGDCTVEVMVNLADKTWPALADVIGMSASGASELEADNYVWTVGIDTAERHPKWYHEGGAGVDQGATWTDVSLPVNEWIYMAFVRDDTAMTITLYINGTVDPFVHTYATSASGGTNSALGVGGNQAEGVNIFEGLMAGARVRSVAATAAEIAATWDRINPNSPSNLVVPAPLPEITPDNHASLTLWHEAPAHDLDDGDVVQTPTALAGANGLTQATVGNRPIIYPAAGEVGWKMFDGTTTRYFLGTAITNYIDTSPANYHVFTVFLLQNADQDNASLWTNHRLYGDDPGWFGAYARSLGGASAGVFEVYGYHWDGAARVTPHVVSRYEPHLLEHWYDTGTGETVSRIDDGPEVRVVAGNIGGAGNMEIGGNPTDDFQGVVMSWMCANGFDSARRIGIRNYFGNKYGINV